MKLSGESKICQESKGQTFNCLHITAASWDNKPKGRDWLVYWSTFDPRSVSEPYGEICTARMLKINEKMHSERTRWKKQGSKIKKKKKRSCLN